MSRPKKPTGTTREKLNATVDPVTLAAIIADMRPGESRGQVLDRWAKERPRP